MASAGPYASLHLAPDRQPRQHTTTPFFTGRMLFLPPNQQRQSTEGSLVTITSLYNTDKHTCFRLCIACCTQSSSSAKLCRCSCKVEPTSGTGKQFHKQYTCDSSAYQKAYYYYYYTRLAASFPGQPR